MQNIPTIVKYIVNRIYFSNSVDSYGYDEFLRKVLKFDRIGAGCEANVYSRNGFEYVIKIVYDPHAGNNSSSHGKSPNPKHFVEGYTFELPNDNYIVVQKKVITKKGLWRDKKYNKFRKFLGKKFPNISDVIGDNCGYLNGRLVCFDWVDNNCR